MFHHDFCSPNAGQIVFKMVDLKDEIIQIFETSFRGDYVFVTNLGKVCFLRTPLKDFCLCL